MNGLNVKYAELCSLSLVQPFYVNTYCRKYTTDPNPDFVLQPTKECMVTMKNLDLIWKYNPGNSGIHILSRVLGKNAGGEDLLRFLPAKNDKLTFWILVKNPEVFNFDTLPLNRSNPQIFYFTNKLTDLTALRDDLHLSISSGGTDINADTITRSGSDYKYHHTSPITPGTAKVRHVITGIDKTSSALNNQAGEADIHFDLSTLPIGKCKLLINNIEQETFYHTGPDRPLYVFGIAELLLSNTLDTNYRLVEADNSLTADRPYYKILFPNRPTLWRYTLELAANSPVFLYYNSLTSQALKDDFVNRLNIITNDTAITFTKTYSSPDSRKFQFISDNTVLLREKYYSSSSATKEGLKLTLKKWIGIPAEAALVSDLQIPSTGNIDALNDPLIYSDILLTI